MGCRRVSHRELEVRRAPTEEQPGLIEDRSVPVLLDGQKRFEAKTNRLTSMKSQKTWSVSTDCTEGRSTNSLHVFLPLQAYLIYATVKGL